MKVHAFGDDALSDWDAVGLSQELRAGRVSPDELLSACLSRLEQIQPKLHAVSDFPIEKLISADRPSTGGFFEGVPTFIKDLMSLEGLRTGFGSLANRHGDVAIDDDPFMAQYFSLGFTAVGKSRLSEFGFSPSAEYVTEPAVGNPWNSQFSSGGSSSGAGALVASGVVPIAHGGDGGGSIRIPAHCCGLVGLKPSRGRLIKARSSTRVPVDIVSQGVLTRSVRDTAQFYAEAEKFYRNEALPQIGLVNAPGQRPLKIGMVSHSLEHQSCDQTLRVLNETCHKLDEMGHSVELTDLDVPKHFIEDFTLYWCMLAAMVRYLGTLTVNKKFLPQDLDPYTKGLGQRYLKMAARTPFSLYRLQQSQHHYRNWLSRFDVIVSPVVSHTTPELGFLSPTVQFDELFERIRKWVGFTPLHNASGAPSLSLPMGFDNKGLPVGILFSGQIGDEKTLLELAFGLEEARPWKPITKDESFSL